jgi:transcriptional regulator with XRE-family HTH domain
MSSRLSAEEQKKIFAERLKFARLERGLTMTGLGKMAGISDVSIHHMEAAKIFPSFVTFVSLALALDVSLDFLAGIDRTVTPDPPAWIRLYLPALAAMSRPGQEAITQMIRALAGWPPEDQP